MDIINKFIKAEKWPSGSFQLPALQAHRGYQKNGARENTLEAFAEAKKLGAQIFECDVRVSKDKIPVIFHDDDCLRIAGVNKKVAELTAQELFDLTGAPTLESILRSPDVPLHANIELKTNQIANESLERRVVDIVQKTKAQDRVMFSSFNPLSVWKASLYAPEVPRALLVSFDNSEENKFILKHMMLAPFLKLHMLNLEQNMVNEYTMKTWNERAVPISVWTVNFAQKFNYFFELGVKSIITDNIMGDPQ